MSPGIATLAAVALHVVELSSMLYLVLLFGRALFSWFDAGVDHPVVRFVIAATEPPRRLIQHLLPRNLRQFPVDVAFLLLFALVLLVQAGAEAGLVALSMRTANRGWWTAP